MNLGRITWLLRGRFDQLVLLISPLYILCVFLSSFSRRSLLSIKEITNGSVEIEIKINAIHTEKMACNKLRKVIPVEDWRIIPYYEEGILEKKFV